MKIVRDIHVSDEVLEAISDEEKMQVRESIIRIHKRANRDKILAFNNIQNRAVAAVIVIILTIGAGIIFFNNNSKDLSHDLISEDINDIDIGFRSKLSDTSINSKFEEAVRHYNNRQYKLALSLFKSCDNSIASRLYTGYCYKMLGQFDAAVKEFKYIINDKNNLYIDQAEWNLASVYFESGNINSAKSIYEDIANKNSSYKKKAQKILEIINN